jgi:hypothetical protein
MHSSWPKHSSTRAPRGDGPTHPPTGGRHAKLCGPWSNGRRCVYSGDEVGVEVDRDALDGPEIVVRRTDNNDAATRRGLLAVVDQHLRARSRTLRARPIGFWRPIVSARTDGGFYLDTSALGRILLAEPDAGATREALGTL